jgi:hypothetical protein
MRPTAMSLPMIKLFFMQAWVTRCVIVSAITQHASDANLPGASAVLQPVQRTVRATAGARLERAAAAGGDLGGARVGRRLHELRLVVAVHVDAGEVVVGRVGQQRHVLDLPAPWRLRQGARCMGGRCMQGFIVGRVGQQRHIFNLPAACCLRHRSGCRGTCCMRGLLSLQEETSLQENAWYVLMRGQRIAVGCIIRSRAARLLHDCGGLGQSRTLRPCIAGQQSTSCLPQAPVLDVPAGPASFESWQPVETADTACCTHA